MVARGYATTLLVLAAIWGSSFMFIKVAVDELSPAATMLGRCLVASIALGAVMAARRGPGQTFRCLRDFGRAGVVLGVVSTALPFWLIAWGETRIDSGIAAIASKAIREATSSSTSVKPLDAMNEREGRLIASFSLSRSRP